MSMGRSSSAGSFACRFGAASAVAAAVVLVVFSIAQQGWPVGSDAVVSRAAFARPDMPLSGPSGHAARPGDTSTHELKVEQLVGRSLARHAAQKQARAEQTLPSRRKTTSRAVDSFFESSASVSQVGKGGSKGTKVEAFFADHPEVIEDIKQTK